jgi:hypothetical protein
MSHLGLLRELPELGGAIRERERHRMGQLPQAVERELGEHVGRLTVSSALAQMRGHHRL